jgi:hypothetical protein
MSLDDFPDESTVKTVIDQLTPLERDGGVVYIFSSILNEGVKLDYPSVLIEVPWPRAALAFVDRDPRANWSHSSRYMLVNLDTGSTRSYEAKFPPFQPGQSHKWRLLYKAPAVPAALVMIKPE